LDTVAVLCNKQWDSPQRHLGEHLCGLLDQHLHHPSDKIVLGHQLHRVLTLGLENVGSKNSGQIFFAHLVLLRVRGHDHQELTKVPNLIAK